MVDEVVDYNLWKQQSDDHVQFCHSLLSSLLMTSRGVSVAVSWSSICISTIFVNTLKHSQEKLEADYRTDLGVKCKWIIGARWEVGDLRSANNPDERKCIYNKSNKWFLSFQTQKMKYKLVNLILWIVHKIWIVII